MAYKDAHSKASTKYNKSNVLKVNVNINRNTDADIIAWFESIPNKQGYIKELIRKDMNK